MKLKSVEQESIELGQPLATNLYDKKGVLLLKAGQSISTKAQLDVLARRGLFGVEEEGIQGAPQRLNIQKTVSPFEDVDVIYSKLESILSNPGAIENFTDRVSSLARMLQAACSESTDAALANILLKTDGSYSLRHSIDAAILCEVIGQALQMPDHERISLLCAAFTQNMGMTDLQNKLHFQKDVLSNSQYLEVRLHPGRGFELLRSMGVTDQIWLGSVLQHHETINGRGYPAGIKGSDIILQARLLALADYCCAKITSRHYRKGLSSHKAMQNIFPAHNKRFDPGIAEMFIKVLGIYLPGTVVRLRSGHIAVVTGRGNKMDSPVVYRIIGTDGIPMTKPLRKDTSEEGFGIVQVIFDKDIKVNRYWLWRHGAFKE